MSIKQLENLLTKASSTAHWWQENQHQLKKLRRKNFLEKSMATCAMLVTLGVGFKLTVGLTTLFVPIESLWGFGGIVVGSACIAVIGETIEHFYKKRLKKWPKGFTPPCEELTADMFCSSTTIDLKRKSIILQRIANHPDPAVQQYINNLSILQDLELPNAWWRAVENALEDIPNLNPMQAAKSDQQHLAEVFVEIEQKSEQHRAPKILKV